MENILPKTIFRFLIVISLLLTAYFIFFSASYVKSYFFLDHIEPSIASLSYIFQKGGPVYFSPEAAEIRCLLYGPLVYALNGFFMLVFGASIFSSKVGGVLAAWLSLALAFFALKKILGFRASSLFLGYISLIYLVSGVASFWNRPDPYISFFVALGLFSVLKTKKILAAAITGVALGLIANLKMHAWLYLMPVLCLLYSRYGIRFVIISIGAGVAAFFLPLLIFKNVSFQNYISSFVITIGHGLSIPTFLHNAFFVLSYFVIVPQMILLSIFSCNKESIREVYRENKTFILSLLCTVIIITILAAKPGADRHHFLPLAILFAYLYSLILKKVMSQKIYFQDQNLLLSAIIFLWIVLSLITSPGTRFYRNFTFTLTKRNQEAMDIVKDIRTILAKYPTHSIEMGYGKDYYPAFYRPLLVFAGNDYFIDPPSLMELEVTGRSISGATLGYLKDCKTQAFLIPKGNRPFELNSLFWPRPLFSEEFKRIFVENYELKEQTRHFDIWMCGKQNNRGGFDVF
jgi:4-amino-4-deoxy-L-arabinose transferase-like glycosyltransferase